ncbi:hypothetical protein BKA70DRAFT_1577777 [Coprinopsis sp. MPI-PUGE-AT-0042]|nr:hypothetical protein BKA70DRAFT_1577777 [Coprinopsis sp. MPI-PUGE-AT-0042]
MSVDSSASREKKEPIHGETDGPPGIPPEVVTLIVKWALIGPGHYGLMGSKERQLFRVLRSICRLWRATLFSMPFLWRGLSIRTDSWSQSEKPRDKFIQQLTSWYTRGGEGAPLSLHVHSIPKFQKEDHRLAVEDVISLLRSPTLNFTTPFPPYLRQTFGTLSVPARASEASHTVPELCIERMVGAAGNISHILEIFDGLTTLCVKQKVLRDGWQCKADERTSLVHIFPKIKTLYISGDPSSPFFEGLAFPSLQLITVQDLPAPSSQATADSADYGTPLAVTDLVNRSRPYNLTIRFDYTCAPPLHSLSATFIYSSSIVEIQALKCIPEDRLELWRQRARPYFQDVQELPAVTFGSFSN